MPDSTYGEAPQLSHSFVFGGRREGEGRVGGGERGHGLRLV